MANNTNVTTKPANWTKTHEILLKQEIAAVRNKLSHYTDRASHDAEDLAAIELYTAMLNSLRALRPE